MRLKAHHIAELTGIALLLGSTAMQLFYLEPLKREIEWRLVTFSVQQSGQTQTRATYDSRIDLLTEMKAAPERIKAAEAERDKVIERFKTADANISDFLSEKENVETWLEWIVIAPFGLGSFLAGAGRLIEIQTARQHQN